MKESANKRIFVINPGSTSTKIALFEAVGEQAEQDAAQQTLHEVFSETLRHNAEELQSLGEIKDQLEYRKQVVMDALVEHDCKFADLSAIVCRGGLVRQIPGGTYRVNDALVRDCRIGISGQHASNLGALIGCELESESGVPAYVVDPPVVNELSDIARYSGYPSIERTCVWHALNQKAIARRYAASVGKAYEDLNLLICHMGGGVSVGAHVKGKVLDTEDAVSGEGPFSAERAGSLPVDKVVDMCLIHDLGECFTGDIPAFIKTDSDRQTEDSLLRQWVDSLPTEVSKDLAALYEEMDAQQSGEAKLYKALDKLEAIIQHNESPIDTWAEHEYELNKTYGFDAAAFSEWLTDLRKEILADTLEKIEQGK